MSLSSCNLLIDASNVNSGGGLVLLKILIRGLTERGISFFAILDQRITAIDFIEKELFVRINPLMERRKVLKKYLESLHPKSLFCFGSYPPPNLQYINRPKVFTYFHNPHLIDDANLSSCWWDYSFKNFIKKKYLSFLKMNTDFFIVQTLYMQNRLMETYSIKKEQCLLLPFYDSDKIEKEKRKFSSGLTNKKYDYSYISFPYPHKNHHRLLDAFEILFERNITPSLVLTVPEEFKKIHRRIASLIEKGLNIVNVGGVQFEDAVAIVNNSQYCIFPSVNETLGLGLVESVTVGTKVIASDLPYINDVIAPSLSFNPFDTNDIVEKIIFSLDNELRDSELKLKNRLNDLISILNS